MNRGAQDRGPTGGVGWLVRAPRRADGTSPLELSAAAVDAAAELLARARDAVRVRVSRDGVLDREALEREQHAVHGLAWLATYVEALRQLQGWAERLEAAGALGELERDLLAVAFGEYLARILGGIPMSQGETVRLGALGLDPRRPCASARARSPG